MIRPYCFSLPAPARISLLQSWTKVLGTVLQYFSVIPRFPLKTVQRFRNFLAVLPPPTRYKVETRKKILDTRVQHCLWGEGRGWTCVNWKTPQRHKSVPRRLNCSRMQIAVLQLPTEENLFLGVNKVKPHKQVKNTRNAYRLDQRRGEFLR